MSQLKLDPTTHDLVVEDGSFAEVTGREEIAQHVKTRLLLYRSECRFNTELGIPYLTEVFEKNVPPARVRAIFHETIRDTPGIETIEELTLGDLQSDRSLAIQFRATTDEGELIFTETLPPEEAA